GPMKMAALNVEKGIPLAETLEQMLRNLMTLLPRISRLKLCKVTTEYANSHLLAISVEVLVLASGKDNILPIRDEARWL
ncbi:hypothetical protein MKW98_011149, partial [Papaver atlanticum]